jgi:hypothetical protein
MITARSKAKKEMKRILDERINLEARVITRFFRFTIFQTVSVVYLITND